MNRFFHYRKTVLAFLFLVTLGLGAGLAHLRFDYTPQYVFHSQNEKFKELQEYEKTFGKEDHTVLIIFEGKDLFTTSHVDYFRKLSRELESIPDLKTRSLFEFFPPHMEPQKLKKEALKRQWLRRLFLSEDGTVLALFADINPKREKVRDLRRIIGQLKKKLDEFPPPQGVKRYMTGIPYIRLSIVEMLWKDQQLFLPLCGIIFLIVLYILFRRWSLVIIPFFSILMALIWTLGLMGWCGKSIDIINNVLPTLIFTIAIADSIHLLSRYLAEVGRGHDQDEAIAITVGHLKWACFFTSFTTAVGFFSLLIAEIKILWQFGVFAGVGVLFAYMTTILFLPVALSFTSPVDKSGVPRTLDWNLDPLAEFLQAHPVPIALICLLLMAGAGYLGHKVDVNNYLLEAFSKDDEIYKASRLAERKLAGLAPMAIVFEWEKDQSLANPEMIKAMEELAEKLRKNEEIRYVISPATFISEAKRLFGQTPFALPSDSKEKYSKKELKWLISGIENTRPELWDKFVKSEEGKARILAYGKDAGAKSALVWLDELYKEIDKYELEGVKIKVTDVAPVAAPALQKLVRDLRDSLFLAFIIIFITMTFLFRSLKIGLVSLLPNIAPLLFAIGYLGAVGLELQSTTIFVFPIALGLAVDDTIHYLARYRESLHHQPTRLLAVEETLREAGKAIAFTTILLGIGFVVLLFSQFPITQRFAVLMEIIIVVALLADVFLLTTCLFIFHVGEAEEEGEN